MINNSNWELVYNILTPEKPESLNEIKDDDIIGSISVNSKNNIIRKVNARYRKFIDRFTREAAFKLHEETSQFVDDYIGEKSELDIDLYLYSDSDTEEIAQRYLLYNSLTNSTVSVKGAYRFILNNLNDKIWLNLDRLYKRFGGRDRMKIGIISKITKNGSDTSVEFNDLSNVFNRVLSIAPDTSNDFTSATDNEKIKNAFVCDNTLEIPDLSSDQELGQNIIG